MHPILPRNSKRISTAQALSRGVDSMLNAFVKPIWNYVYSVFGSNSEEGPFDVITLSPPDKSIIATFVSFGATLTELWVPDRDGRVRNVVLGYDDNAKLQTDPAHPVFNSIIGRYANRIKKGLFTIPIQKDPRPDDRNVYKVPLFNENMSLHGGKGWDKRDFSLVSKSSTSVTFKHVDVSDEGFPGTVTAYVTFTVENGSIIKASIKASATELTPILLTQHTYWNLDAFEEGDNILNHILQVDADTFIETDPSTTLPSGKLAVVKGTRFDFKEPQAIGARLAGSDDVGYNDCLIFNKSTAGDNPNLSVWSPASGIRLDIRTNQPATMVYTADYLDIPRRQIHGGPSKRYTKWSAIAIEPQSHVDAINNPEWGVDQIYGPGKDYEWESTFSFSVLP